MLGIPRDLAYKFDSINCCNTIAIAAEPAAKDVGVRCGRQTAKTGEHLAFQVCCCSCSSSDFLSLVYSDAFCKPQSPRPLLLTWLQDLLVE